MRMSCNGCRVLRKGCSENCSIRPCLQWIKSPDSQAHATVFLAKFYGRAGLMNLITSGPDHLRPAIFRSLLYEACGRIVNPISGSVGLLWSGSWNLCQNAVEAVLRGAPITQIASDVAESSHGPPLKAYDIRHVSRDENSAGSNDLRKVRTRCRFKRSVAKPKASRVGVGSGDELVKGLNLKWRRCYPDELTRSTSHESSVSHVEGERRETTDSMVSDETAEEASALTLNRVELESVQPKPENEIEDGEVGLELALGLKPYSCSHNVGPMKKERSEELCGSLDDGTCKVELGLYHPE